MANTSDLPLTSIHRSEICVLCTSPTASVPWRQGSTVASITNHLYIAIFASHNHQYRFLARATGCFAVERN